MKVVDPTEKVSKRCQDSLQQLPLVLNTDSKVINPSIGVYVKRHFFYLFQLSEDHHILQLSIPVGDKPLYNN